MRVLTNPPAVVSQRLSVSSVVGARSSATSIGSAISARATTCACACACACLVAAAGAGAGAVLGSGCRGREDAGFTRRLASAGASPATEPATVPRRLLLRARATRAFSAEELVLVHDVDLGDLTRVGLAGRAEEADQAEAGASIHAARRRLTRRAGKHGREGVG
jgi:hypothetical protein